MRIDIALPLAMAAVLMTATIAGTAVADSENQEATALEGAKVSLAQAITVAEQQTGGKAYDAGVDAKDGQPRIVVETNGPRGVQTVSIDAQSGQIVGGHAGGEED